MPASAVGSEAVASSPRCCMAKTSVHPPTAARWDPAQLLDVDMDHVAGVFILVAADDAAGRAIHPGVVEASLAFVDIAMPPLVRRCALEARQL